MKQKMREFLIEELKGRFNWLGTDEDVDGADVIDALVLWYEELTMFARRAGRRPIRVGVQTYTGGEDR